MFDYYSLNRVIMVGTVGRREPELQRTNNDRPYTRFNIYTSERRNGEHGRETKNTTHRVMTWGKQAEFCANYIRPGMKVCIEGRLTSQAYEMDGDKKVFINNQNQGSGFDSGVVRHYSTEIVAQNVIIIDNGREGGGNGGNQGGYGGGNQGGYGGGNQGGYGGGNQGGYGGRSQRNDGGNQGGYGGGSLPAPPDDDDIPF